MGPGSDEIEDLRARLATALQAVETAETELGQTQGELTETSEQLALAVAAQQEWDELLAQQREELRQCCERLEAIETSTTWRVTQTALGPYRFVRSKLGS